jgi:hypothetical protein
MRTGGPKIPLSPDGRRELESLAHRSRSVPAPAGGARIVLPCAAGQDNRMVAGVERTIAIVRDVLHGRRVPASDSIDRCSGRNIR